MPLLQLRTALRPLGLACMLTFGLAACGGGSGGGDGSGAAAITSGSSTSTATETPAATTLVPQTAAMWTGSTSTGRNHTVVIFDGGRSYFLYNTPDDTATAGTIVGNASRSTASLLIDGLDFNWEGLNSARVNISGSLDDNSAYNGTATYAGDASRNFSFTSSYQPPSAQVVSMNDLAGAYVGTDSTTVLSIDTDGQMRGIAFSRDCTFTGTTVPSLNYTTLMHISLTFQGGTCRLGTGTFEGIALYDPAKTSLRGVALLTSGTGVVLLQVRKY